MTKNVLISGASGLVGSALTSRLKQSGYGVFTLVRHQPRLPGQVFWDPYAQNLDLTAAGPIDIVIHLSGENVAAGLWTEARKKRIRDSRVLSTSLLASALAQSSTPPRLFVCASAIGIYGDRGAEELTEASAPGDGFLADVCKEWELAAEPARKANIRTCHLRIGLVLSAQGGILQKMLLPFWFGLGGRLGSGAHYLSWISLEDLVRMIEFTFSAESLSGPVNAVGPTACTNAEFTKELAKALHRPAFFHLPEFLLRMGLKDFADEILLSSMRVVPKKMIEAGFSFQDPTLASTLSKLLA